VKLPVTVSSAECPAPKPLVLRSLSWGVGRFFDVDQDGNEENKKMLKMKSGPNKVLKTKLEKKRHF